VPFVTADGMLVIEPLRGWTGRFFHSQNMTFGHWAIAAGADDLHEHRHVQEEVWNVVSGAIVLVIDGEERRLDAGDAAVVPPDVSHAARVLGACEAVVVDHPTRLELPSPHPR
jgi:mannose-6-phosphate isomerase-like protein (cupin superfamily)